MRVGILEWWNAKKKFGIAVSKDVDFSLQRFYVHMSRVVKCIPDVPKADDVIVFEPSTEKPKPGHQYAALNVEIYASREQVEAEKQLNTEELVKWAQGPTSPVPVSEDLLVVWAQQRGYPFSTLNKTAIESVLKDPEVFVTHTCRLILEKIATVAAMTESSNTAVV